MEITKQDIRKINTIARVLGSALEDIQELAAKIESCQQPEIKKDREAELEELEYIFRKNRRN